MRFAVRQSAGSLCRLECSVEVAVSRWRLTTSVARTSSTTIHRTGKRKPSSKHLLVSGVSAMLSIVLQHMNCGVAVQHGSKVYSIN